MSILNTLTLYAGPVSREVCYRLMYDADNKTVKTKLKYPKLTDPKVYPFAMVRAGYFYKERL